jgi:hypothetical protein
MKYHHSLVALVLAVALAACQSAGAPASHAARLGQEVRLAPGEQASFDPHGLIVEFVKVLEDSRCPTDVTCVWAGEVKLQLATRIRAAAPVQHEITAGQDATIGEFRLAVVRVEPERLSTREISPEQYRVMLRVDSNQTAK